MKDVRTVMRCVATTVRRPRISLRVPLLLLGALLFLGCLVYAEIQSAWVEGHWLSAVAEGLTFRVEPGPSAALRFPRRGPYDQALGYTRIGAFSLRLRAEGWRVAAQAHMSPRMLEVTRWGLYPPYHEKNQAGLSLLDHEGRPQYLGRFPARAYRNFAAVPPLVVHSLLYIENRDLLDSHDAMRNPAVSWSRFGRALLDQAENVVRASTPTPGGSTLATQIVKFRHSPNGRTTTRAEKLRQMASASLRAYLDGPHTLPERRRIVADYLDTEPLSAKPGIGEIDGLGDGLWAWYGRKFAEVNTLLREPLGTGHRLARQALAYKEVLSLLLAQRAPSLYLGRDPAALARLSDAYLRRLAAAKIIPVALRDAALATPLPLRAGLPSLPQPQFVDLKAATASRVHLSALLGVPNLYDLDRLDLRASTTLDAAAQRAVTAELVAVRTPEGARAAGLYGHEMLRPGDDPGQILWSFTLYQRHANADVLRVQTDDADVPFDINQGARLNLGSTAKLRTLILYLQIVNDLRTRYAGMSPGELRKVHVDPEDALTRWALDYLEKPHHHGVLPMLDAAMDRRYSASPAEAFHTGGSWQTFSNYDKSDNGRVLTVREAFQHSVNLVFVRLMRDIVHHEMFEVVGSTAQVLANPELRRQYLERFAEREGGEFVARFYRKYCGKTPDAMQVELMQQVPAVPLRLAVALRSIAPEADFAHFEMVMRGYPSNSRLSDGALHELYARYGQDKFSLSDRGALARVHPLELWVVAYLRTHPRATLAQALSASRGARLSAYAWLFRTRSANRQDLRIKSMIKLEAYREIGRRWRALGYPFASITPSYASAIGAAGDRPEALAKLMGIIVADGLQLPVRRLSALDFAVDTPYETRFIHAPTRVRRTLPPAVAQVVRRALLSVVADGTAARLKGAYLRADGSPVEVGGKTGTGDQRYAVYTPGGRLIESRRVNRSATFVFLLGDRFFGTVTAYVHEPYAAHYTFTSAMAVQLLRDLAPELGPLIGTPSTHLQARVRTAPPIAIWEWEPDAGVCPRLAWPWPDASIDSAGFRS